MSQIALLFKQGLQTALQHKLARNVAWSLGTELFGKVSRLVTLIALAAYIPAVSYGQAMLALACHEVIRTIMRFGAGSQIVQCAHHELTTFAENAITLQWLLSGALCALQFTLGYVLGLFYNDPTLSLLIQAMAFTYLLFPVVGVTTLLIQRNSNFRFFSLRNGLCITGENLSVAAFAFVGADVWSVVAGKYVFAVMWVIGFSRAPVPAFRAKFDPAVMWYLFTTSAQLFTTEAVRSIRQQADLFIAGRVLSAEWMGVYAFARSAGIGLSQTLSQAFTSALYPQLCQQHRNGQPVRLNMRLLAMAGLVGGAFLAQAIIAPVYIPILFADRWNDAIPVVSVLCVTAIPALIIETHATAIRATGAYYKELVTRVIFAVSTVCSLLLMSPASPIGFAVDLLISSVIGLLCVLVHSIVSEGIPVIFQTKSTKEQPL
ncbi:oligosaccharide flippase family protein [Alteromonas sp. AMM-1]|uniref:oligosaccharide flippase family protein n=1 Tax=Alteromonas sp. AMM-1 TaxID=3394233 RepID=UPI0039A54473